MKRQCLLAVGLIAIWWSTSCGGSTVLSVKVPALPTHADGMTPAAIAATITYGGSPLNRGSMSFTSSIGSFMPIAAGGNSTGGANTTASVVNGTSTVQLYSTQAGTAEINVTWTDCQTTSTASASASVVFGSSSSGTDGGTAIASITFISATPASIGLKGSGNETSKVLFQCQDNQGNSVPAGLSVNFSLPSQNLGTSLSPATAQTDMMGQVFTTLSAGNTPGSVTVTATAGMVSVMSQSITIVGAQPSYNHFTFSCSSPVMGGGSSAFDGNMQSCLSIVADRNSNKLSGVQVSFESEAGAVDPLVTTDMTGTAISTFTSGQPYPEQVVANTQDFDPLQCIEVLSFGPNFDNCLFPWTPPATSEPVFTTSTTTGNPRRGVTTVIAYTSGEEGCGGIVTGGQCMCGSAPCAACADTTNVNCFVDLPEPFIDENDNGTWDPGEPYIDVNQNGKWDGPNGKWDAQTDIWRSFRVIWSTGPVYGSGFSEVLNSSGQALSGLPPLQPCASTTVTFRFIDVNGNPPAAAASGDGMTTSSTGNASVSSPTPKEYASGNVGWGYWSAIITNSNCGPPPGPPAPSGVTFTWNATPSPGGSQTAYSITLTGSY
jgi:hypothetical protein